MNFIELVHCKIDVENVVELVKTPECGAVSVFMGTTRNNFNGKEVKSLKYEAYESMAMKVIATICDEIRFKWPLVVNIAIYHRMGEVKISETSVLIAISSPHRKESLDAVSYAIDTLKSTVPIWKKEEYYDSTGVWKVNKECSWGENSNPSSS